MCYSINLTKKETINFKFDLSIKNLLNQLRGVSLCFNRLEARLNRLTNVFSLPN